MRIGFSGLIVRVAKRNGTNEEGSHFIIHQK